MGRRLTTTRPTNVGVAGTSVPGGTWKNFFGNVDFSVARYVEASSEERVVDAVRESLRDGHFVRAHGAGHSNTPIVTTDGTLLDLQPLGGLRSVDTAALTATFGASTTVAQIGQLLWEHGLSLANQGDINAQFLAGAVSTATHGTGIDIGSFSGSVHAVRIVTAQGELREVGAADGDLLRAARTSIGTLGVLTEVTIDVVPAFALRLDYELTTWDDLLPRWEWLVANNRHFSFYWCPHGSIDWAPATFARDDGQESVVIKTMNPMPEYTPTSGRKEDGSYVAPAWQVWPDEYLADYHEFEYMVPADCGVEAMTSIRDLMQNRFPDEDLPVEVRFGGPDDAMLSPFAGRHSCVISVSGQMGTDNSELFAACHDLLARFGARPHWGKAHCFDADQLRSVYPEYSEFCRIRGDLDPDGLFLNPHLRGLFA